jgi:phenylalanyl-tRNA synthetase beta chain
MKVSLSWLRELVDLPEASGEIAERLTMSGFEVEAVEAAGAHLSGVVVGEVLASREHPSRGDLRIVDVGDGERRHQVVCGAPNVPPPGGKAAFGPVGAKVGDVAVEDRKLGGVDSRGVLFSEAELNVGADAVGLLLLPDHARPGTDLVAALGLADTVFDVNVMPNRPDALGHLGLARELSAIFRRPLRPPRAPALPRAPVDRPVTVRVEDAAGCPRYGAQVVAGLAVRPSPWPVRYRLHLLGVRAVSNLVDVTNLVLLLFGQPLHAFDLALVRGRTIVVRRARPGERMTTLDGVERAFAPEDLLICDGEGPVAAAGVMGGEASGVRPETSEVLIECAHFDPRSIRRTSRRLGLASESSYRFERGTDRGGVPEALACAAGLMVELGGGKACGEPIDVGGPGPAPAPVRLRPARVARIVGRDYPAAGIAGMLGSLGCRTTTAADGTIDVLAPSWRQDLGREIDLVEEIARLDGYGAVPTTVPAVAPGPRRRGNWERLARVRGVLVARGLAEAVNHVFVEADVLAAFGAAQDECVRLRNPLDVTRAHLRTTLLPGLLADVRTAFARREASAALFEIGRTFHRREGAEAPEEVWRLGIVLAGCRPGWLAGGGEAFDLYDAAGALEAVAAGALRAPLALRAAAQGLPMLHPRAACVVEIGGGRRAWPGSCIRCWPIDWAFRGARSSRRSTCGRSGAVRRCGRCANCRGFRRCGGTWR